MKNKFLKNLRKKTIPLTMVVCMLLTSIGIKEFHSETVSNSFESNETKTQKTDSSEDLNVIAFGQGTSFENGNLNVTSCMETFKTAYSEYFNLNYQGNFEIIGIYDISMQDAEGNKIHFDDTVEMELNGDIIKRGLSDGRQLLLFQSIENEQEPIEEREPEEINEILETDTNVPISEEPPQDALEKTGDTENIIILDEETSNDDNEIIQLSDNNEDNKNEEENSGDVQVIGEVNNIEQESETVEEINVSRISYSVSNGSSLNFETDRFSKFILVLKQTGTGKGTQLGKSEYMEIDKYLESNNSEMNGQETYKIYLEQSYHNEGGMETVKMQYAPLSGYATIILDQSTTMRNEPTAHLNSAMNSFLHDMLETNIQRMEDARQGLYADIDGTLPENELREAMKDHLMYVSTVIGYNREVREKYYDGRGKWEVAPLTQEDVDKLISASYIVNDNDTPDGQIDTTGDIQTGTHTGEAMEWAYDYVKNNAHYATKHFQDGSTEKTRTDFVILMTDGMPNGRGKSSSKTLIACGEDMDVCFEKAQQMKDEGVTVFAVYERGIQYWTVRSAVEANNGKGSIDSLELPDHYNVRALFMALLSSDSPKGGSIGYSHTEIDGKQLFNLENPAYIGNRSSYYTLNYDKNNQLGKYTYFGDDVEDIIPILESLYKQMEIDTSKSSVTGYAGKESYVQDVISDPFEITDASAIQVYAVPRKPSSLDMNGIPEGIEINPDSPDYGYVENFKWGDRFVKDGNNFSSEWINVTSQVSISVRGNVVKVSGWDYEINALTHYDKDILRKGNSNPLVYNPGDYGYKLVVEIPINAHPTFGGNNIETNNSDLTAFFPSEPDGFKTETDTGYIPSWKENTEYNPDGNDYVEKYPVPKVDLNINYKIVKDDMTVYAPQTAEIRNLVSNESGNIWYADDTYWSYKKVVDDLYEQYQISLRDAQNASDSNNPQAEVFWEASEIRYQDYLKSKKELDAMESYIPDGINNAFVNIDYVLKDPDGEIIGTLHIPHGKPYVLDDDGIPNMDWEFKDGPEAIIKKSGEYTISCTITPVDTTRAPGGHVSKEGDSQETIRNTPYDSQEYSPTGSTATGSQSAAIITEQPQAHLFQLKITTDDSRRVHNQTLDFNIGTEPLLTTENIHFLKFEWVCTDGKTPSNSEDEPGNTGLLKVGSGVMASSQIPDLAMQEGLVEDVDGTLVIRAEDGQYVPVSVILARNIGDINKSSNTDEQVRQTQKYMTDSDNIWGDGISSVIWVHECGPLGEEECNAAEFAEAQKYSTIETADGKGKVQYLIHVMDNPAPDILKETSTPRINRGADILWKVTLSNDNEAINKSHRSGQFSVIDILPYNEDGRIDPDTGREGSSFHGELSYKEINVDYSLAAKALEACGDEYVLYYTEDQASRNATEEQLNGTSENGAIEWKVVTGTIENETVSFSVPMEACAIKLDCELAWEESIVINMKANLKDASVQEPGDYYHNEAIVLSGNGMKSSNVVATEVVMASLSGTVWEDLDSQGIMTEDEPKMDGIVIRLYKEYDPMNPGPVERTEGGIKLSPAYDASGDMYPPIKTGADGFFEFKDIPDGNYYVIAERIPEGHAPTIKNAAEEEAQKDMDSKAEESYVSVQDDGTSTAWIKKIVIEGQDKTGQNIGLKPVYGSLKVHKTLDEIFYDSSMPEEDRQNYRAAFTFTLTNVDTGSVMHRTAYISGDTLEQGAYVVFEKLPFGTYVLTEETNMMYELEFMSCESSQSQWDEESKSLTIRVGAEQQDFEAEAHNILSEDPPGSTEPGVNNNVKAHIPIKMEIKYVGPDPIKSDTLTKYTFTEKDFDPADGGDIIITFDDGSQTSLSEGTLEFGQVALTPKTVTNRMNTGNGGKYTVTGYYSENGHLVSDVFDVAVDLKPPHKFTINFNANGSQFDTGDAFNTMNFGYDVETKENYVTMGTYKDAANKGLKPLKGFEFSGWNTKEDGTGIQYSTTEALNSIGGDDNIKTLTLYACWKTNVRFYAGTSAEGAKMSGGITDAEKLLNNKYDGYIKVNYGQTIATNLQASKTYHIFMGWNTKADGSGIDIKDYGKITGPVTFYAVYYRYQYPYVAPGRSYTMTLPMSGWWELTVHGAAGLQDADFPGITRAKGGTTIAKYYFAKGTKLKITPGGMGVISQSGGYNGGGRGSVTQSEFTYGVGGGMTDIRYATGSQSMIIVAGGGGGGWQTMGQNGPTSYQYGNRQGYDAWNYGYGAGQNASGNAGGGGGGWPSGKAGSPSVDAHSNQINCGAGGKGYIASGAKSSSLLTGNWNDHGFAQVYWTGY